MNPYFYVAADFDSKQDQKNFNIWAYAMVVDEKELLKAIDTVFYINRRYKKAIIRYGFTSLSEKQLQKELNKSNK